MDNTVKKISVYAPAKINLCLFVRSRREDGYHNIESVMQTVDLCDRVTVTLKSGEGKINVFCRAMPTLQAEKNTAYRAVKEFFAYSGKEKYDVSVDIEKRIPSKAGLGGGSSDAAAVLRALDILFKTGYSDKELMDIGARIGADVPFLIRRGTALVTGIGENIRDCTPSPSSTVLIAFPNGECVSTKDAYEKIDVFGAFSDSESFERMESAMKSCDISAISAVADNTFERVIPENSAVFDIKKTMLENGALMSLMSGSGSAVFGLFTNVSEAKKARDVLSDISETFICGMFTREMSYIES